LSIAYTNERVIVKPPAKLTLKMLAKMPARMPATGTEALLAIYSLANVAINRNNLVCVTSTKENLASAATIAVMGILAGIFAGIFKISLTFKVSKCKLNFEGKAS